MKVFKNKSDYSQWKNSDDAPYPHCHSTEGDITFDYWVSGVNKIFEDSELTDIGRGRYQVNNQIHFAYTIFNQGFDVEGCDFLCDFCLFNNCEFNGRVFFQGNKFEKAFDLSNAHFNNPNYVPVIIENCHFIGDAKFDEIESNRVIIIRNCIFHKNVNFNYCSIHENITIQSCTFNDGVDFSNTRFNKKLYFLDNKVEGVLNFSNCEFNKTANIVDTEGGYQKVLFSLATIKGMLQFNGWNDKMYLSQSAVIDFTHAFIEPSGYVIIRNINDESSELTGSFDFSCANILGHVVMTEVYADKLNLASSSIIGSFNTEEIYFATDPNSQTFVRLKNEALRRNDSIRAMKFKAKEMVSYKKELNNICKQFIDRLVAHYSLSTLKIVSSLLIIIPIMLISFCIGMYIYVLLGGLFALLFVWTPIGKLIRKPIDFLNPLLSVVKALPITEHVLLWLNTISNRNGLSWWRGFVFTITVAWLFFIVINYFGIVNIRFFEWGWKGWYSFGEVWRNYLNMFYLTDFKDKFFGVKLNSFGETVFFISKIFIGYGIYQTISAFRKYGK
ncbi:MAG: pentapeptide repeat-containing protein [Bacteroidales bacterium]